MSKKRGKFGIIFGLLAIILLCFSMVQNIDAKTSTENYGYSVNLDLSEVIFQLEWTFPLQWCSQTPSVLDIDLDGTQEILLAGYRIDADGQLDWYRQSIASVAQTTCAFADLDGDNSFEIIVGLAGQIRCLNSGGVFMWKYEREGDSSLFKTPCIADVDDDSHFEIISSTDWDGLFCISHEGLLEWHVTFPNPGKTGEPSAVDINNDGIPEILVTHGKELFCLDGQGNILWVTEFSSYLTKCLGISNFDFVPTSMEMIVSTATHLHCVSNTGMILWSSAIEFGDYDNPLIVDIDSNGLMEIILCSDTGEVYCYGNGGNQWWQTNVLETLLGTPSAIDFNSDGFLEIVVASRSNHIIVIDSLGHIIISYDMQMSARTPLLITDLDGNNRFEIITICEDDYLYCWELFGLSMSGDQRILSYNGGASRTRAMDSDGDYIDDTTEMMINSNVGDMDSDNDELIDGLEYYTFGTSLSSNDTDNDMIDDKTEIFVYQTNALTNDTDSDTLSDFDEIFVHDTNPRTGDSDSDTMPDNWEIEMNLDPNDYDKYEDPDNDQLLNYAEYNNNLDPHSNDTDSDLLPDKWEVDQSTNPRVNDSMEDPDQDNLTNWDEYTYQLDPLSNDTDSDMLSDYEEVFIYPTNPRMIDTDFDGLTDYEEVMIYGTSPILVDSDGDLIYDYWEIQYGLDPFVDDSEEDWDNDSLTNFEEYVYGTSPSNNDTDSDTMPDYFEVTFGLNPNLDDTKLDPDHDNLKNFEEYYWNTNPMYHDTDFDGVTDGLEVKLHLTDPCVKDTDTDGMDDGYEVMWNLNPLANDASQDLDFDDLLNVQEFEAGTNPWSWDTDQDGLDDHWEVTYNTRPLLADHLQDYDWDYLTNYEEYLAGTLPTKEDSDSDNLLDGYEVRNGLNPLVYDSHLDYDHDDLTNLEEAWYYTNPHESDSDFDDLNDYLEVMIYNTHAMLNDTDQDGMLDGYEVKNGLDPHVNDASGDPDGDYISNIREMRRNLDPLEWDNWWLLYGVYLLPVWIVLSLCYVLILKMLSRHLKAKQRGFNTHKEERGANVFGFLEARPFREAKYSGFSTQEQYYEAVHSGFITSDEWFDAKVSGFDSIDQKMIAESIGFMNFHEFLDTLNRELRKYKFRINKLFSILIEVDSSDIISTKKLSKYHKSIIDIIKVNTQLHMNLVLYTNVPIGDHALSKDLRNEIERGDELLNRARIIASDLFEQIRVSSS